MVNAIDVQLKIIDSLLQSEDFALTIAESQASAYYKGVHQPVPPFFTSDAAPTSRRPINQPVAVSLADFYALECGLGALVQQTKEKPTKWLQRIANNQADAATLLLLSRFANATWKISQPFICLGNIRSPSFVGAGRLPAEAVEKVYNRLTLAAEKLLSSLHEVEQNDTHRQMEMIKNLLHSVAYAEEMATWLNKNDGDAKDAPLRITDKQDRRPTPMNEQKIATNLAGFYALEGCSNYFVTTREVLPSEVLQSILDKRTSQEDKDLFARFANATWKASQPFRGLKRIERATFCPYYFLSAADIEKDWVQIQAAANILLPALRGNALYTE